MRLVSYERDSTIRLGILHEDVVIDIQRSQALAFAWEPRRMGTRVPLPASCIEFLEGGSVYRDQAADILEVVAGRLEGEDRESMTRAGAMFPTQDIVLKPPVPRPGKMICVGLNYRDHALEARRTVPRWPTLFGKTVNALIGPGESIVIPEGHADVDYEAELAVVIGGKCKGVEAADALSVVAGFAAFNDVTAREFQKRTSQWFSGKNFDTFAPMGPLATLDEVTDPQDLRIRLLLNGGVMQDSSTKEMIFSIPQIIERVTEIMTLEAGDIIATGTPAGVGFLRSPPVFLQPGDEVSVEISSVGYVTNLVEPAGRVDA